MRIICCACSIEYEGRINTSLEPGERLILIKDDNSFSIHASKGYKPINYMTAPNTITLDDQEFDAHSDLSPRAGSILVCSHDKTGEQITILIHAVLLDNKVQLKDNAKMQRVGNENDFQLALIDKPDFIEKGMVVLEREKRINTGVIDLFCMDKDGRYTVVELKRAIVPLSAVGQLHRYVEEVKEMKLSRKKVRGIFVAPRITPKALELATKYKLEFNELTYREVAQ